MAILITTDGMVTHIQPNNDTDFTLEELQTYVGGFIEIIRLPKDNILVVNEEGLLQDMQINTYASLLAQQTIVGNVVYCKDYQIK